METSVSCDRCGKTYWIKGALPSPHISRICPTCLGSNTRPIQEQDLETVSIVNEGQRVVNEVIRVYKDKPVWAAIRKMIEQGAL